MDNDTLHTSDGRGGQGRRQRRMRGKGKGAPRRHAEGQGSDGREGKGVRGAMGTWGSGGQSIRASSRTGSMSPWESIIIRTLTGLASACGAWGGAGGGGRGTRHGREAVIQEKAGGWARGHSRSVMARTATARPTKRERARTARTALPARPDAHDMTLHRGVTAGCLPLPDRRARHRRPPTPRVAGTTQPPWSTKHTHQKKKKKNESNTSKKRKQREQGNVPAPHAPRWRRGKSRRPAH